MAQIDNYRFLQELEAAKAAGKLPEKSSAADPPDTSEELKEIKKVQ